jgi:hypothetical protein
MEDFETPRLNADDDADANSDLAAALIRFCPHLSPDLRKATYLAARGGTGFTLH